MLIFFWRSRADNSEVSGEIWQKFELIQVFFMHVLVTFKNEEDPMKNECAGVATTFRFAQGRLTPQPLVRSASNSNSAQTLWLSLLPERMEKILSKMWALEWSQDFLHYNPMGAICCHGNQSSNPTWSKT